MAGRHVEFIAKILHPTFVFGAVHRPSKDVAVHGGNQDFLGEGIRSGASRGPTLEVTDSDTPPVAMAPMRG